MGIPEVDGGQIMPWAKHPATPAGSHWDDVTNPHPSLNQAAKGSGGIGASNQEVFSQRGAGLASSAWTFDRQSSGEYGTQPVASTMSARDYKCASDLVVERANAFAQPGMKQTTYVAPALGLQTDITPKANHELQFTLKVPSSSGGGQPAACMDTQLAVRRLTPVECERLQGFPDGHTDVPYRKKPAADGPRYKAIGNSMAVPVMAWIGRRIADYLA